MEWVGESLVWMPFLRRNSRDDEVEELVKRLGMMVRVKVRRKGERIARFGREGEKAILICT